MRYLTSNRLKPCPFCGEDKLHVIPKNEKLRLRGPVKIVCESCETSTGWQIDEKAAVEAWNRREKEMVWVPVDERLPDEGKRVLIWYAYRKRGEDKTNTSIGIGYHSNGHWHGDAAGANSWCIAWMPMPDTYKENENEIDSMET